MARPCTHRSPRCNFPLSEEDNLVGGLQRAPTKDSNLPTPSPTVSQAQTPALAPAPTPPSNKGLFQQFIKAYLENQNQNKN